MAKSSCTKLSVSDCRGMLGCTTYKRKGKGLCRKVPKGRASASKRGKVVGTALVRDRKGVAREVKRYKGPRGGEYYIRNGRKVYA